jgi:exonuclease SbcC
MMIIKEINIRNFRSHKNTNISFNKGITTIIGQNGSGKSSIFEAMNYALYAKSNAKIDDLKKRDTNYFIVELVFEIGGVEYRVLRRRGKGGNEDKLYINGRSSPSVEGNSEVNNKIKEILGIDRDVFLNAIYIKQGEISNLINLKPAERKKLIGKLLGIDKYEKTWEELKNVIVELNGKLEYIKGELNQIDSTKNDIDKLKEEISTKEKKLLELQNKYDVVEKIKEEKEEIINQYNKKEKRFNELNNTLAKLNYDIESLKKDIDNLKNDLEDIDKYRDILIKNNEEYIKFCEIEKDLKEISKKITDYKEYYNKFNKLNGMLENLEKNLTTIKNTLKNINPENKDAETIKNEIEYIKKEIDTLDKIMDKLKDLENINKELNEIEKNKKELKENEKYYQEYLNLNNKLKELNKELVNFEKLKEKERNIDFQIDSLIKKKNELQRELADFDKIESKINAEKELTKKYDELLEKIKNLNKLMAEKETKINQMDEAIEKLEKTDNKCPVCKSNIDAGKKEELLKTYCTEIEKEKQRLVKLNKKYNNYNCELKKLKNELEEIGKLKDEFGKLKEKKINLENVEKELNDYQNELIKLKKEINKYTSVENEIKSLEKKKNDLEEFYNKYNFCLEYLKNKNEQEIIKNRENILKFVKNYDKIMVNDKKKELNNDLEKLNNILGLINDKDKNENELKKILEEIENVRKEAELYVELEQKKSKMENEKSKHEYGYNNYKNALAILENYSKRYGTDVDSLINVVNELLIHKNRKIEEMDNNRKNILEDIENLDYDETFHNRLKEDYKKISSDLGDINNQIIETTSFLKSKRDLLQKQENKLDELHRKEKEKENLEGYIDYLRDIRENIFSKNGFQQYLREKYIPLIQRYTNEIFSEFELPYCHIQIMNDYDIVVDNLPVKNLSGGEQIAVSLALRLGIAKAVCNNVQCIILDEPTAFLDEDRRKNLLNIFGNIKTISQIFVISHHDELEQVADNIITVKKIGDDSKIKIN